MLKNKEVVSMLWKSDGKLMKTPSTYTDEIEDLDNDSYRSAVTGALIDTVIAKGILKCCFTYSILTEEEAQKILQETFKNPMRVTIKSPSISRWNDNSRI